MAMVRDRSAVALEKISALEAQLAAEVDEMESERGYDRTWDSKQLLVKFKKIKLFFGTRTKADLCYYKEMLELEKKIPNFEYVPCLSQEKWEGILLNEGGFSGRRGNRDHCGQWGRGERVPMGLGRQVRGERSSTLDELGRSWWRRYRALW